MMTKVPITVIFLTLNEEFHIGEAIDNVKDWAEDIFVLDSLSSDRTVDIVLSKGVKLVQRPFTDFSDQWNFALEKLPITTPWIMKMDPDERTTKEFRQELAEKLVSGNSAADGYSLDLILYFMGRPMNHCLIKSMLRIWKTGEARFSSAAVNEHLMFDGKIEHLKGRLLHFDSADLHVWLTKQNRYTSLEALMKYRGQKLAAKPLLFGNRLERIMFVKKIFYHLPFRYLLWGSYCFFLRGAWKSGVTGYYWALMRVFVMRMTELKWREMEFSGREITIPKPMDARLYDPRILATELQARVNPASISSNGGEKTDVSE